MECHGVWIVTYPSYQRVRAEDIDIFSFVPLDEVVHVSVMGLVGGERVPSEVLYAGSHKVVCDIYEAKILHYCVRWEALGLERDQDAEIGPCDVGEVVPAVDVYSSYVPRTGQAEDISGRSTVCCVCVHKREVIEE